LDGLEIDLGEDDFTCITGPSGCGKTTLLRILLGLDEDFAGSIDPALKSMRTAAVFQEPRLLPWRSVEENIRLVLRSAPSEEELTNLLRSVGLGDFRTAYPAELSLGMARRVSLARAFAIRPRLLVLDEPFVSLDEALANTLRDLLLELCRRAPVTVVMVTHDLSEAARLADRIIRLSKRPAHVAIDLDLPRVDRPRTGKAAAAILAEIAAA
jgi:NitT/TauT family transport system ATP-binding protein